MRRQLRSTRRAGTGIPLLAVWAVVSAGCSRVVGPSLGDTTVAFAVRTALVNDRELGTAPIEIEVRDGVVTLTGRVASAAERERALAVARGVDGVRRVELHLAVAGDDAAAGPPEPPPRRLEALATGESPPLPRVFAVGGVLQVPVPLGQTLDSIATIGPVFRFGRGTGWHPVIAFTWTRADLPAAPGTSSFGVLRMAALSGGVGYSLAGDRWSVAASLTGGYSFNHIRLDPGSAVPQDRSLPVAAGGSAALIPSATLWLEASRRVSVGLSTGYLLTRPRTTWIEGDRFARRTLKADVVLIGVSAAYWVF